MKENKPKNLFYFFLFSGIAHAEIDPTNLSSEALTLKSSPIVTIGYIFQVFISLLIIICLIYISAKYLLPRLQMPLKGRLIEIVDRIGIEPQVSAYILKVKDKFWLIISGKNSVQVVDKIDLEEKDT